MMMYQFFNTPFAESGDKETIPVSNPIDNSVSYTNGFGLLYSENLPTDTPPGSGLPVPREAINELYYEITNAVSQYQSFGTPLFITPAMNNGIAYPYLTGAYAYYNGEIYQSLSDNNTDTPGSSLNWKLVDNTTSTSNVIIGAVFAPTVTTTGQAVFWDASNNRFDLAIANGTLAQNMVGIADIENSRVFTSGYTLVGGLTNGAIHYLSPTTAGDLTNTKPLNNIISAGIAINNNYIVLNIQSILAIQSTILNSNAYISYPNGTIFQSGYVSMAPNSQTVNQISITFPTPFPTNIISFFATCENPISNTHGGATSGFSNLTNSSAIAIFDAINANFGNTVRVNWWALGY